MVVDNVSLPVLGIITVTKLPLHKLRLSDAVKLALIGKITFTKDPL